MLQLLVFLSIGVLLLGVLLAMALRSGKAEGGASALVEAQRALEALQSELLAPNITARIFARDDLAFVRAQGLPASVEALFLKERRRVALIWVDCVRQQIGLLRRLHLGSARYYAKLSVKTELALAFDFSVLRLGCRALQVAFIVGGPYAAPKIAGVVTEVATRVCGVSQQSLAFLASSNPAAFPASPGGGSF